MKLGLRDVYATVIAGVGLVLALSVTQGWGWPLLNGVRAGVIVLGVAGMVTCSVSGWAQGNPSFFNPFMIVGALLGVVALGVAIAGLIVGTMPYLVALMVTMALLWVVTILHRSVAGTPGARRMTSA